MKSVFTVLLLSVGIYCLGQTPAAKKPDTISVNLSAFERQQVTEHENVMQQVQKHNQEYLNFLAKYFAANGIDPNRVTLNSDSLKFVGSKKFLITLRPESKGSATITQAGKAQK